MWAIPTGTSSALKRKTGKESQYMVSCPELGSDPPIGSGRESGRDIENLDLLFEYFIIRVQIFFFFLCLMRFTFNLPRKPNENRQV